MHDPEILHPQGPPPEEPGGTAPEIALPPPPEGRPARTPPHAGDAIVFFVLTGAIMFLVQIVAFSLAMTLRPFGNEGVQRLLHEPRLIVPSMAVSYIAAALVAVAIFAALWHRPFARGIHWNAAAVRRSLLRVAGTGVVLSVAVQILSNYLPIPKALPIDEFFRTRSDVWLVAIFGTFIAPPFEELAFRGFLLPALATAWDWTARLARRPGGEPPAPEAGTAEERPGGDPHWSVPALAFSFTVTSILFAMLHAGQLAHAWAPLAVLFCVSLVLCAVRLRMHSLAASALVHAVYNFTIFLLIFFATDGFRHLDKLKS